MNKLLQEIDQLKKELDLKRPLLGESLANMKKHFIVEMTYHSNSIEGSTLTYAETKVVLEDGITIGGKTVREHLEAINHKEAILFLEDMVQRNEELTEQAMKQIHGIILRGIDSMNAGVYRKIKVLISGAVHVPPEPLLVADEMSSLMVWYHGEAQNLHPLKRAAILHSLFVRVHPFSDGNGRTARLLLNLELMKTGYVPIIIKNEQRLAYYQALDRSHMIEDYQPFIELVGNCLKERLELYLEFFS